ncbi:MAG: tetratricopeptide repeat protein,von Willebrand factor type A-like protein [Gammaproteobacteria bacterium]|nr:tetratricopeptide repeat protein,von Willebrand factor type A-like protein [Gammaproteobacteria bacterium]
MSAFAEFHFLRPLWSLALLPLLVLLWLMVKSRLASRSWELVCDAALLPYILTGTSVRQRRLSIILTGIGGLLVILALAGPVWEKLPQPVFTRSSALVLALDLSRSMDAADISPSRLLRARFKIADILQRRTDGQTALLVYAGDSFIVTPLTDDSATITSQLQALTTEIMPVPGNNTLLALHQAEQLLKQAGAANGEILLITDEIDFEQAGDFAADLHDQGYQVSVLAVGTEQGVPIPQADGSFLKDSNGGIVVPVLLEEPMRRLAATGGGIYQRLAPGDEDTDSLLEYFAGHERTRIACWNTSPAMSRKARSRPPNCKPIPGANRGPGCYCWCCRCWRACSAAVIW